MNVGFFTVLRSDPQHFLHAASLVREVRRHMPGVPILQMTDMTTPIVPGVDAVRRLHDGPMLERRLEHYTACDRDEWLLLDTDVSVRGDLRSVFEEHAYFQVAFADRAWSHLPQGDHVLTTMPFNTGVAFSRTGTFWADVLSTWRAFTDEQRADWMSEQRAVWAVARRGDYRVRVLDGMAYNRPPASGTDACDGALLVHYKGPRKAWLSKRAHEVLSCTG